MITEKLRYDKENQVVFMGHNVLFSLLDNCFDYELPDDEIDEQMDSIAQWTVDTLNSVAGLDEDKIDEGN